MSSTIVIGAQWGDEGKGKIVDILSQTAHCVTRFAGGDNAGHTIQKDDGEKIVLRMIPSGILNKDTVCYIGPGCVVNIESLLIEIENILIFNPEITKKELQNTKLFISPNAHVVMPYHIHIDTDRETSSTSPIGSTKRGIGPCYEDKARRKGIKFHHLKNEALLKELIAESVNHWKIDFDVNFLFEKIKMLSKQILPYVKDYSSYLSKVVDSGYYRCIFEGAQGTLLDIDHGTYPYVTSSTTTSLGVQSGSGTPIPIKESNRTLLISKIYTTRVGNGPFPTELFGEECEKLRAFGHEYGSVTGRPRRCGWLDLPALRYAEKINGKSELILTKLDIFQNFDTFKVCVGYKKDNTVTKQFPIHDLSSYEPVYKEFKSWKSFTSINWDDLPQEVVTLLQFMHDEFKLEVTMLSIGPKRSETIFKQVQ